MKARTGLEKVILSKLDAQNKPIVDTGYPWIMTTCLNPKHNDTKPSFSVNLEDGHGHCFSCGFTVNFKSWVAGLDDGEIEKFAVQNDVSILSRALEVSNNEHTGAYELPKVLIPPRDTKLKINQGWRGLTQETIDKLGLYVCSEGHFKDRIIMPMKNIYGKLGGVNSRALKPDMLPKYLYSKYIEPEHICYPEVPQGTDTLIVVEGIFDAISLTQDGLPAVFNFGTANIIGANKIKYLLELGVTKIVIALDNDEAGKKGLIRYLTDKRLRKYFEVIPSFKYAPLRDFMRSAYKDYNDFYVAKQRAKKELNGYKVF